MAKLVYSTGGDVPDDDRRAAGQERLLAPREHAVRVCRERGKRGGKTVTVAQAFFVSRQEASTLLKELKRRFGTGGALKRLDEGFALELQGDHADALVDELVGRGFGCKRAGG